MPLHYEIVFLWLVGCFVYKNNDKFSFVAINLKRRQDCMFRQKDVAERVESLWLEWLSCSFPLALFGRKEMMLIINCCLVERIFWRCFFWLCHFVQVQKFLCPVASVVFLCGVARICFVLLIFVQVLMLPNFQVVPEKFQIPDCKAKFFQLCSVFCSVVFWLGFFSINIHECLDFMET